MLIGGIEAGGTKMVYGIGDEHGTILEQHRIPTAAPQDTMAILEAYFRWKHIDALGIGSFGPLDLREDSPTYGYLTTTTKPGWSNLDFLAPFRAMQIPIGFDTDVNAAVLGEVTLGSAKGADCALYLTVGTGIGLGVYVNGQLLHGLMHPEGGHIKVRRHPEDHFAGCCPYHGDCLEGLASGTAIKARYGAPAEMLKHRKRVWELESDYLAQALATYSYVYSPQKIILGGGVMHQAGLLEQVREKVKTELAGYLPVQDFDSYITAPMLGDNVGLAGAIQLGLQAYRRQNG